METSKSKKVVIKRGILGLGSGSIANIVVSGKVIRIEPDKKGRK